jgi:division/cell wall cluster transcriptional repressor MraZ
VASKSRTAVAAGTIVVLTGLALTFQVLQFEFASPARAGSHAAAPPAAQEEPADQAPPVSVVIPEPPAVAAPAPAEPVRLSQPTPAPVPETHPPEAALRQPVQDAAPEGPRRVTASRWSPEPSGASWSRPLPVNQTANAPPAEPARAVQSRPAPQPMPAAAAAPPHRQASRTATLPFTGTHTCLLADGGTLGLPEGVRRQVEASPRRTLFVMPGPEPSLWLFTGPGLERWAADPDRAGSTRGRAARRLCLAQTEACAVDRGGRLHLPEHLSQFAGLCQDVVLLGVGDHLELWDAQCWQQHRQRPDATPPTTEDEGER